MGGGRRCCCCWCRSGWCIPSRQLRTRRPRGSTGRSGEVSQGSCGTGSRSLWGGEEAAAMARHGCLTKARPHQRTAGLRHHRTAGRWYHRSREEGRSRGRRAAAARRRCITPRPPATTPRSSACWTLGLAMRWIAATTGPSRRSTWPAPGAPRSACCCCCGRAATQRAPKPTPPQGLTEHGTQTQLSSVPADQACE